MKTKLHDPVFLRRCLQARRSGVSVRELAAAYHVSRAALSTALAREERIYCDRIVRIYGAH